MKNLIFITLFSIIFTGCIGSSPTYKSKQENKILKELNQNSYCSAKLDDESIVIDFSKILEKNARLDVSNYKTSTGKKARTLNLSNFSQEVSISSSNTISARVSSRRIFNILRLEDYNNGKLKAKVYKNRRKTISMTFDCRNLEEEFKNYKPKTIKVKPSSKSRKNKLNKKLTQILKSFNSPTNEHYKELENLIKENIYLSKSHYKLLFSSKNTLDYKSVMLLYHNLENVRKNLPKNISKNCRNTFKLLANTKENGLKKYADINSLYMAKFLDKKLKRKCKAKTLLTSKIKLPQMTYDYFIDSNANYDEKMTKVISSYYGSDKYTNKLKAKDLKQISSKSYKKLEKTINSLNKKDSDYMNLFITYAESYNKKYPFTKINSRYNKQALKKSLSNIDLQKIRTSRYDITSRTKPKKLLFFEDNLYKSIKLFLDSGYKPNTTTTIIYNTYKDILYNGKESKRDKNFMYAKKRGYSLYSKKYLENIIALFDKYGLKQKSKQMSLNASLANAVYKQNSTKIDFYLKSGAKPNEKLLKKTIIKNMQNSTKEILRKDFKFNVKSIVELAIDRKQFYVIDELIYLKKLKNIDLENLAYELYFQRISLVRKLFKYGADPLKTLKIAMKKHEYDFVHYIYKLYPTKEIKKEYKEYEKKIYKKVLYSNTIYDKEKFLKNFPENSKYRSNIKKNIAKIEEKRRLAKIEKEKRRLAQLEYERQQDLKSTAHSDRGGLSKNDCYKMNPFAPRNVCLKGTQTDACYSIENYELRQVCLKGAKSSACNALKDYNLRQVCLKGIRSNACNGFSNYNYTSSCKKFSGSTTLWLIFTSYGYHIY